MTGTHEKFDTLDDTHVYLPELWATYAKFQPGKEAIVCGGRRVGWGAFNAGMNRVANRLIALGLGRGDAVAVLMGNSAEMLAVVYHPERGEIERYTRRNWE